MINYLDSNAQVQVDTKWTANGEGEHSIYIAIDLAENVPDSNRDNNIAFEVLEVLTNAPDLLITTINFSPTSIELGDKITFNVTVKNLGNVPVNTVIVGIYEYDSLNENYLIGNITFTALLAGKILTKQFVWEPTSTITYDLFFAIDPYDEYKEFNESNNAYDVVRVTVNKQPPIADLMFPEDFIIVVSPSEPRADEPVTISIQIRNDGDLPTTSVILTLKDGARILVRKTITDLKAFDSKTEDVKWTPSKKGTYFLTFEIDSGDLIPESYENNNMRNFTVEVLPSLSEGSAFNELATAMVAVIIVVILIVIFLFLYARRRRVTEWAECSECQAKMPLSAEICPSCGAEFSDEMECGECHKLISIEDTKCPNCGAVFVEDADDKKKPPSAKDETEEPKPLVAAKEDEEAEKEPMPAKLTAETEIKDISDEPKPKSEEDKESDEIKVEVDDKEFREFEKALDDKEMEEMDEEELVEKMLAEDGEDDKDILKDSDDEPDKKESDEDKSEEDKEELDISDDDESKKDKEKPSKDEDKKPEDKDEDLVLPGAQWTAECYKCNARIPLSATSCPECGAEFE
jgi:hypothetical protein